MAVCEEALEIARKIFPDKSVADLNDLIWECTGYPQFWEEGSSWQSQMERDLWAVKNGTWKDPITKEAFAKYAAV